MRPPLFIGDEISAAGFRLAGVRVRSPAREELSQTLHWANTEASLVMLSADCARWLPADELQRLLAQEFPLFVVIPDVRNDLQVEHLTRQMRRQLGVLA